MGSRDRVGERLAVVSHFLLTPEMEGVHIALDRTLPAVNPSEWDSLLRADFLSAPYYLAVMRQGFTEVTSQRTLRSADVLTVVLGQNEHTDMRQLEECKRWLRSWGCVNPSKKQYYTLRLRMAEQQAQLLYPVSDKETLNSLTLYSKYYAPMGVVMVRVQSDGSVQVVDLSAEPMSTTLAHHVGRATSAQLLFLYKTFD